MRKRITAIILAVIMILTTFGTVVASAAGTTKVIVNILEPSDTRTKNEEATIKNMLEVPTTSDALFRLYIDKDNFTVAIQNKKTGEIMLSNPTGDDATFTSQLKIDYKSNSSTTIASYYTYKDCIAYFKNNPENPQGYIVDLNKDTGKITSTNSVTVHYKLGLINQYPAMPEYIGYNEMQAILELLKNHPDGDMSKTFKNAYSYNSVTLTEPDADGVRKEMNQKPETKEGLITKYGAYGIENEAIYIRTLSNRNRLKVIEQYLKDVGYSEAKKLEDYAVINYVEAAATVPIIDIDLTYTVTDTGFKADVDASKIKYDVTQYTIEGVGILPFFNAANVSTTSDPNTNVMTKTTESGYTFIPDGSGALVRFEDVVRQGSTNDINFTLYGSDNVYYSLKPSNQEQITMPVFGMVIDELPYKSGFFAIIESGDAVASITSAHSARTHSVYASFKISASDRLTMASSQTGVQGVLSLKAQALFTENCSVNYVLLVDDEVEKAFSGVKGYDTSYIGMAECYRDYLYDNGILEKFTADEINEYRTKLFVEVLGSMKVEKKVLTFPVTVNESLTTFEQIKEMRKFLTDRGVGPINFILTGFANEGLSTKYPTKIKWLRSVGGKKGFESLLEDAKINGYEVSPNFDFAYSTYIFGTDNIKYRQYGAKSLDKRFAMKLTYDPAYQMLSYVGGIVISTGSYDYVYDKFAQDADKYDMTNLAVGSLGSDLNSDFNEDRFIYRTESVRLTQKLLDKLSINGENTNTNYKLLVRKGNSYTYKYVDYIVDAALDSSRRTNESEAIPFLGIVLHGSVTYTGEALNMDGDADYAFLKALESGANLYFTLAYENVENLKLNWRFAQYYSVSYELWRDEIVEIYNEYNKVMASKQNSYIVEHEFLNTSGNGEYYKVYRLGEGEGDLENSRVVRVEYDNGEGFFINYNTEFAVRVIFDGESHDVPALGYLPYTTTPRGTK